MLFPINEAIEEVVDRDWEDLLEVEVELDQDVVQTIEDEL